MTAIKTTEQIHKMLVNYSMILKNLNIDSKLTQKGEGEFLYIKTAKLNGRTAEIWFRKNGKYQLYTRTRLNTESTYHENFNLKYVTNFTSFEDSVNALITYYNSILELDESNKIQLLTAYNYKALTATA